MPIEERVHPISSSVSRKTSLPNSNYMKKQLSWTDTKQVNNRYRPSIRRSPRKLSKSGISKILPAVLLTSYSIRR